VHALLRYPPKCKNSPLTPIVTKISFASFSARRGPPIPKLPRFRSWCLLYPEPKFHADRTILRWDILNRTNKQKNKKKQKANLISRQTLRYGEITKWWVIIEAVMSQQWWNIVKLSSTDFRIFRHGFLISKHVHACRHGILAPGTTA